MDFGEFAALRQGLEKTQRQMSQLLGTSIRSVQSFEQGWRKVPVHIERQMLFLLALKKGDKELRPCWEIRKCPPEARQACPAWEFNVGHLCWFISGTLCRGNPQGSWSRKIKICRKCEVFAARVGIWRPAATADSGKGKRTGSHLHPRKGTRLSRLK